MDKEQVKASIHGGFPIKCSREEYSRIRKFLHEIASDYADNSDIIRMDIALQEIKRLDKFFEEEKIRDVSE